MLLHRSEKGLGTSAYLNWNGLQPETEDKIKMANSLKCSATTTSAVILWTHYIAVQFKHLYIMKIMRFITDYVTTVSLIISTPGIN